MRSPVRYGGTGRPGSGPPRRKRRDMGETLLCRWPRSVREMPPPSGVVGVQLTCPVAQSLGGVPPRHRHARGINSLMLMLRGATRIVLEAWRDAWRQKDCQRASHCIWTINMGNREPARARYVPSRQFARGPLPGAEAKERKCQCQSVRSEKREQIGQPPQKTTAVRVRLFFLRNSLSSPAQP